MSALAHVWVKSTEKR